MPMFIRHAMRAALAASFLFLCNAVASVGDITTLAGGGSGGDGGPATSAIVQPYGGMARDPAGNLYIVDFMKVRRVDPSGTISTFAGGGTDTRDNIPATTALLAMSSRGIAADAAGNVYVAEPLRVRKIDTTGTITTVAGQLTTDFDGEGVPATSVRLHGVSSIALDAGGSLYIAEYAERPRVRKVDPSGVITTVAGNGSAFSTGDGGAATNAGLVPHDIAFDAAGNLYITDVGNGTVRKVDSAGIITTVAGTGVKGYSGDGGPALQAQIHPEGVSVDPEGNIYISEYVNHRVRRVGLDGTITTIAGTGQPGFSGDNGPAVAAALKNPLRLYWDAASGAVLVGDSGNSRVRAIVLADSTPDAFSFQARTGVPLSSVVQSETVTLSGFAVPTPITVAGGEYSIGCDGTFVAAAGTVSRGQAVCVRHTASATPNKDTTTTLVVGGRVATLRSTTVTGAGTITLSSAALDFGAQSMHTTSPELGVTLTNSGAVEVSLNSVRVGPDFTAAADCTTLPPGAACTVRVTFTPLGPGTLGAQLVMQSSPGNQAVALTGFGERSLTIHYYRSILARVPEPTGKAFWESEAARVTGLGANVNETWFAMANAFFSSPEYVAFNRTDAGFVDDLYRTFFNRTADAGGAAFWTGQLGSGLARDALLASFMFSREFTSFSQGIFGQVAVRAEVDLVMDFYRGAFARLPDGVGFSFWVQRLRAAQCAGAASVGAEAEAISSRFFNSPEYAARNRTNAQFVGDLYNAFLRRGGDPVGFRHWLDLLGSGPYSREFVRTQFLQSQEFRSRVIAVERQGCVS